MTMTALRSEVPTHETFLTEADRLTAYEQAARETAAGHLMQIDSRVVVALVAEVRHLRAAGSQPTHS
jgi:hypothetical protein